MRPKFQRLHPAILILAGGLLIMKKEAESVPVTMEWNAVTTNANASPVTDLAGYRIYHSKQSFNRNGWLTTAQATAAANITRVPVAANQNRATLELTKDSTYYFRLTAYDSTGNESAFNLSNTGANEEVSVKVTDATTFLFGTTLNHGPDEIRVVNSLQTEIPILTASIRNMLQVDIAIFNASGHAVLNKKIESNLQSGSMNHFEYHWSNEHEPGIYYAVCQGTRDGKTVRLKTLFVIAR